MEVLGEKGEPLKRRTFEDCDTLSGDHLDHIVTWRGEKDLGHPADSPVALRFRLRNASLYSVSFQ